MISLSQFSAKTVTAAIAGGAAVEGGDTGAANGDFAALLNAIGTAPSPKAGVLPALPDATSTGTVINITGANVTAIPGTVLPGGNEGGKILPVALPGLLPVAAEDTSTATATVTVAPAVHATPGPAILVEELADATSAVIAPTLTHPFTTAATSKAEPAATVLPGSAASTSAPAQAAEAKPVVQHNAPQATAPVSAINQAASKLTLATPQTAERDAVPAVVEGPADGDDHAFTAPGVMETADGAAAVKAAPEAAADAIDAVAHPSADVALTLTALPVGLQAPASTTPVTPTSVAMAPAATPMPLPTASQAVPRATEGAEPTAPAVTVSVASQATAAVAAASVLPLTAPRTGNAQTDVTATAHPAEGRVAADRVGPVPAVAAAKSPIMTAAHPIAERVVADRPIAAAVTTAVPAIETKNTRTTNVENNRLATERPANTAAAATAPSATRAADRNAAPAIQTADIAATPSAAPSTSPAPISTAAALTPTPLAASSVPITAPTTPAAVQDLAQIIDRLTAAREASIPAAAVVALNHADFGDLSLRFNQGREGGLSVQIAAADPDAHQAITAAVAQQQQQGTATPGDQRPAQDNAQPQQHARSRDAGASTGSGTNERGSEASQNGSNRQPQSGQHNNGGRHAATTTTANPRQGGIFA